MILIPVSCYNKEAATFAKKFPKGTASIFTCADLAEQSTSLYYPGFEKSTITVEGVTVPVHAITGVVNLLPMILPEELYFFPEEERDYQSAEFHALLTFFLDALPCPVINRPCGSALTGAFSQPLHWVDLAHKLNIPTVHLMIDSDNRANHVGVAKPRNHLEVVCFNQQIISFSNDAERNFTDYQTQAQEYTLQLAKHSGSAYLKVAFEVAESQISMARTSILPDMRNDHLIQHIIDYFQKAS
jgi:hypothetical protein